MTREEAIKMLNFLAIDTTGNLAGEQGDDAEFLVRVVDALDMAIAALREQEERSKGCGWCKQFAGVPLRGFTEHGCQSITVKFCPMCGRRLEEE